MKGWMKRIKSLLKEKCGTFNPMWSNGQQQDAGHFLLFLLEKLDEDLLLEDAGHFLLFLLEKLDEDLLLEDAGHFQLDEDLLLEDGTSIIQKHFKARCVLISA
jgi:ubiquitin C-terminal hydrolase